MGKYNLSFLLRDFLLLFMGLAFISMNRSLAEIGITSLALFAASFFLLHIITENNKILLLIYTMYSLLAVPLICYGLDKLLILSIYIAVYNLIMLVIVIIKIILQAIAPSSDNTSVFIILLETFRLLLCVFLSTLYFVFGLNHPFISILSGIYAVILALYHLSNGEIFKFIKFNKRPIFLGYPLIFDIPLPYLYKSKIDKVIARSDRKHGRSKYIESLTWVNPERDNLDIVDKADNIIKIQIVTGNSPIDIVGHTAVTYQGKTYTYGNHDANARHLFGMIGEGVLLASNAEDMESFNKRLFACVFEYEIFMEDEALKAFQEHLVYLQSETVSWEPSDSQNKRRYAGVVNRTTDTKFFKYDSGIYKYYFFLGTNCAWIENRALNQSSIPNMFLLGVPLPGTVFYILEQEIGKSKTCIMSRRVIY